MAKNTETTAVTEKVFDFTIPEPAMGDETRNIYYRLRRVAILAGDATQFPDGKIYTEQQVIEILGEDYATGLIVNKCCV